MEQHSQQPKTEMIKYEKDFTLERSHIVQKSFFIIIIIIFSWIHFFNLSMKFPEDFKKYPFTGLVAQICAKQHKSGN